MTCSRFASLPAWRRRLTTESLTTATPAESYPRYSSFRSPSTSTGTTSFGPIYAMIPHMSLCPYVKGGPHRAVRTYAARTRRRWDRKSDGFAHDGGQAEEHGA